MLTGQIASVKETTIERLLLNPSCMSCLSEKEIDRTCLILSQDEIVAFSLSRLLTVVQFFKNAIEVEDFQTLPGI